MRSHEKLQIWQLAMDLVEQTYNGCFQFPDFEKFGLANQMRRSAVSIPSNIAEGAARVSHKEFARFLMIARASLMELETQFKISVRLNYLENIHDVLELIEHIYAKINALLKTLHT